MKITISIEADCGNFHLEANRVGAMTEVRILSIDEGGADAEATDPPAAETRRCEACEGKGSIVSGGALNPTDDPCERCEGTGKIDCVETPVTP